MAARRLHSPVVIDLFCGAGGLSNGLAQAGFEPVLGVDNDPHAIATYRLNHPGAAILHEDIAAVKPKDVTRLLGDGQEIDLIAGGPSCQGYSTHGKRIEDDPRNFLYGHFVRMVKGLRPKFFLMENVKGMLTYRGGHFKKLIEDSFARAGYQVVAKVLCAADYGVPQLRHRIVFLGTRLDVPLSFPASSHGPVQDLFIKQPYVTVGEAIGDLPLFGKDLDREDWEYASPPQSAYQRYARRGRRTNKLTLHQTKRISDAASEVVKLVREGQGLRSVAPQLLPERFQKMRRIKNGSFRKDCTTLYYRLSRSAPAYTITCYFRNVSSGPFVHPLEDRALSYREAARLMSFQDGYRFAGASLARQIGNSVPPLLAKALGTHIIDLLSQAESHQETVRGVCGTGLWVRDDQMDSTSQSHVFGHCAERMA